MKAVYERPITDALLDLVYVAEKEQRLIKYIELSGREWAELRAESCNLYLADLHSSGMQEYSFNGIQLKVIR